MITLPKNQSNTVERKESLTDELMQYVAKKIEETYNRGIREDHVVCVLWAKEHLERWETNSSTISFPEDIILNAVSMIKSSGYFVWYHYDYKSHLRVWITDIPTCPHPWYAPM